jgi:hypothetical protein
MKGCTYNPLKNKVAILVSKKRCIISSNSILIKKGVSKKNAITFSGLAKVGLQDVQF